MALAGDEKRIRALFSELLIQDQSAAPSFDELWSNAATKNTASASGFKLPASGFTKSALAVAAIALFVAASWGAWSWYRSTRTSHQEVVNVSPEILPAPKSQIVRQTTHLTADVPFKSSRPKTRRIRHIERPAIDQAALLSRWQSPTRSFMKSPTAVNFSSLPQLNQSLENLKQFLPRNSELTKESNR